MKVGMTGSDASAADKTDILADQVREALRGVLDPCSLFNGTRLSLVELGMVANVEHTGNGCVRISLLLDDPVCLYVADIHHELRAVALAVPGVSRVEFDFLRDQLWTQERATPAARKRMRRPYPGEPHPPAPIPRNPS
jgi:metal-sulfur cluster biosynthetic enzyme